MKYKCSYLIVISQGMLLNDWQPNISIPLTLSMGG